jgi:hypothetical protein
MPRVGEFVRGDLERKAKLAAEKDADAEKINSEHEAGERGETDALIHYLTAGNMLISKQEKLKRAAGGKRYFGWKNWMKDNLRFTDRTAQRYMRFAKLVLSGDETVSPRDVLSLLPRIWASTRKGSAGKRTDNPQDVDQIDLSPLAKKLIRWKAMDAELASPVGLVLSEFAKILQVRPEHVLHKLQVFHTLRFRITPDPLKWSAGDYAVFKYAPGVVPLFTLNLPEHVREAMKAALEGR